MTHRVRHSMIGRRARVMTGLAALAMSFLMQACALGEPATGPVQNQPQAASQGPQALDRPPNIVILLADDLGYGGLGVQGDKEARTPNIDALAVNGVRLTNAYANHPVCSPSRAALMTGIYQHRMGFEFNSGSPANTSDKFGVSLSQPTLPERLKAAGYATGMFGKWHVGFRPETQPTARGFDAFYGHLSGAHAYTPDGVGERGAGRVSMMRGVQPASMPAHLTEAFAEEAVGFIRAHKDRPFLLYIPFNAVHSPMQTTPAYEAKFAHIQNRTRRIHLAMLAAMDDAVGRVVDEIRAQGLDEQTLIMFSSDNGGPTQETTSSNGALNGVKGTVLEGGIRVPTLVRWTGRIEGGRTIDTLAMGFDLTATALAAAGLPTAGLDGVDLMPWLTGARGGDAHEALFWRAAGQGAVRAGNWKLVKNGEAYHLFDLSSDIRERTDLAAARPDVVADLRARYDAWSGAMAEPLWIRNEKAEPNPRAALDRSRSSAQVEAFIRGERPQVSAED